MFNNPPPAMMYEFTLRTVGLAVGIGLLVTHLVALAIPDRVCAWLKVFPRSRPAGLFLCS
ncbi:MAG: hypothetical protein RIQ71_2505, partial [Verrucomicrobiota bacterium]